MELWSAFLIGLLGSFHCVGMCGPIALSLPLTSKEKLTILVDLLIYNGGRIATYSFIGLIVGLFGRSIFFSGYQQQLSITLGVVIILTVLFFNSAESKFSKAIGIYQFQYWLTKQFSSFINKTGKTSLFMIGVLNGFLPCGLVYMAVAGAFTNYEIKSAMLYMATFGLGTLPLMLLVSLGGRSFQNKFKVRKFIPVVAFIMGVLFILRGLSLNIPYVSPKIEQSNEEVICD